MSKKVLAPGSEVQSFSQLLTTPGALSKAGRRGSGRNDPNLRVREEARVEGLELGRAEGMELGRRKAREAHSKELHARAERLEQEAVDCLDQLQRHFVQALDEFRTDMEERLTAIATAIAERVICREVSSSPDVVVGIVSTALNEVMHGAKVIVRANPFDAELLRARQADIERAVAHLESLVVVDDPSIRAGCAIDTDGCSIDARIEAMLERVGAALRMPAASEADDTHAPVRIELTTVEGGSPALKEAA